MLGEVFLLFLGHDELAVLIQLSSAIKDHNTAENTVFRPVADHIGYAVGIDVVVEVKSTSW